MRELSVIAPRSRPREEPSRPEPERRHPIVDAPAGRRQSRRGRPSRAQAQAGRADGGRGRQVRAEDLHRRQDGERVQGEAREAISEGPAVHRRGRTQHPAAGDQIRRREVAQGGGHRHPPGRRDLPEHRQVPGLAEARARQAPAHGDDRVDQRHRRERRPTAAVIQPRPRDGDPDRRPRPAGPAAGREGPRRDDPQRLRQHPDTANRAGGT